MVMCEIFVVWCYWSDGDGCAVRIPFVCLEAGRCKILCIFRETPGVVWRKSCTIAMI